ncbi:MAG: flagellar export chaperone FliS [Candidatus Korobacteraceae bacterium]|jgi:flagellar protein FliS
MNVSQPEHSYRRAAVETATSVGLVVILYQMLIDDLSHAIAAMRAGNIQGRSDRLNHAFAVLGLLEGSLDRNNGGPGAENLSRFYAHLRRQLLAAQFQSNEQLLERQIALILDVQEAWRLADLRASSASGREQGAQLNPRAAHLAAFETGESTEWCA